MSPFLLCELQPIFNAEERSFAGRKKESESKDEEEEEEEVSCKLAVVVK